MMNINESIRRRPGRWITAAVAGGLALSALTGYAISEYCPAQRTSDWTQDPVAVRVVNEIKTRAHYRDLGTLSNPEVEYNNERNMFRISEGDVSYLVAPSHFDLATEEGKSGQMSVREANGEIWATEFH